MQSRLQVFVNSGQLGIFANAYWGHPAYKLPPEGNLLAVAHYLEALDWQREVIKFQALLGGKNPHPQTYLVGGMAMPVDPTSSAAINPDKIAQLKAQAAQALDFVNRVYYPDLQLVASFYPEWAGYGGTAGNYLSFGDFPTGQQRQPGRALPAARHRPRQQPGCAARAAGPEPDSGVRDPLLVQLRRGRWRGAAPVRSARRSRTTPARRPTTSFSTPTASTPGSRPRATTTRPWRSARWRAWRWPMRPATGGCASWSDALLAKLGAAGQAALFSTLGRVAARGIETVVIAEQMAPWIGQLEANMNAGRLAIHNGTRWDPATWPAEASGWGATEAPRGALGHWVRIKAGKIENYQAVVATIWNGSPRDARGQRGPWEQALIGTPVVDPERAGGGPAHHPFLRSLHVVRRARGGCDGQRSHAHPGHALRWRRTSSSWAWATSC